MERGLPMNDDSATDAKRTRWNAKFAARADEPLEPEPFILEHVLALEPGTVLDIACGDGRNALALAARGFAVTGVDFSETGLARLARFAELRQLSIARACIDLEMPGCLAELTGFEAVIISHYLPGQSLREEIADSLVVGGKLIVCTFNERQHEEHGFNARFCLQPDELRTLSSKLRVDVYRRFQERGRHLDGYVLTRVER